MRLFKDGEMIHEGSLTSCAHGYVCDHMEIEPADVQAIISMLDRGASELRPILVQLKNRFKSERATHG